MPPRTKRNNSTDLTTSSRSISAMLNGQTNATADGFFSNNDLIDYSATAPSSSIGTGESIPLISFENDKFFIGQRALDLLKDMEPPLSVVSVAGLYRTGKSFLLNRVILQRPGFSVGCTVNACTKGIWMWSEPLLHIDSKTGRSIKVLVIDTEGIGAPTADASHDTRVFSLALLLSSFFVYNSMGSIDEQALSNLSLVTNISKEIRVSVAQEERIPAPAPIVAPKRTADAESSGTGTGSDESDGSDSFEDEDNNEDSAPVPPPRTSVLASKQDDIKGEKNAADFHEFLPAFLWVVRDFALKLEDRNGNPIEAEQYLENALEESTGRNAAGKNRIRTCLKQFFPDRACVTLVRPCLDENNLQNLDSLPNSSLRPEFMRQADKLRARIMNEAARRPLTMQGKELSGSMLGFLCQAYSSAINRGEAPVIHDAWTYMCEAQRARTEQQIVDAFHKEATALTTTSTHGVCPPLFRESLVLAKSRALVQYTNTCRGLEIQDSTIEARLTQSLDILYHRNHEHYTMLLHQQAQLDHDGLCVLLDATATATGALSTTSDTDGVTDFQFFRGRFIQCQTEFDRLFVEPASDITTAAKNPYADAPAFESEATAIWYTRNTPLIWKAVNRYYAASGHEHSRLRLDHETLKKHHENMVSGHTAALDKMKIIHDRAMDTMQISNSEKLSESADRIATIISKLNDAELRVTTLEAEVMQCSRDGHARIAEVEQRAVLYESRAESAEGQVNILREEMTELLEIQGVLEAKEMELTTITIEKEHLQKQLVKMRLEMESKKAESEKISQKYKKEATDIQERALQSVERMKVGRKADQKKLQVLLDHERGAHEQTQSRVFVLNAEIVQLKGEQLENASFYEEQVQRLRLQTEESDARLQQTTNEHLSAVKQFEQTAKIERDALEAREMTIRDRAIQSEKERCKALKELETRAVAAETRFLCQKRQLDEAEESLKRKRVKTEDQQTSLELVKTTAELNWLRRQTTDQETQLNKATSRILELEALNKEHERSVDGKIANLRLDYEIRLAALEDAPDATIR